MNAKEIDQIILEHLLAKVHELGVGLAFMEPLVIASKLRRSCEPGGITHYHWQNTLLLSSRREAGPDGPVWTLYEPGGACIASYLETPTHEE